LFRTSGKKDLLEVFQIKQNFSQIFISRSMIHGGISSLSARLLGQESEPGIVCFAFIFYSLFRRATAAPLHWLIFLRFFVLIGRNMIKASIHLHAVAAWSSGLRVILNFTLGPQG
jgi:hypothetical protein